MSKILKLIGIKTIITKDSIKIFGNPAIKIKKIVIKNYLGDHGFYDECNCWFGFVKWSIYDKIQLKLLPTPKSINKIKSKTSLYLIFFISFC